MKLSHNIPSVVLGLLVLPVLLFGIGALLAHFRFPSGTMVTDAARLFSEVEATEKINRDAERMFARFGTNGAFVRQSELQFPAVSNLVARLGSYASVVMISAGDADGLNGYLLADFPASIRIRFGDHFHCHFIYIFDARKPFDLSRLVLQNTNRFTLITSNIVIKI